MLKLVVTLVTSNPNLKPFSPAGPEQGSWQRSSFPSATCRRRFHKIQVSQTHRGLVVSTQLKVEPPGLRSSATSQGFFTDFHRFPSWKKNFPGPLGPHDLRRRLVGKWGSFQQSSLGQKMNGCPTAPYSIFVGMWVQLLPSLEYQRLPAK